MPFPRAPKKPVSGTLKLVIRPPTAGTFGEEDPRAEFKDEVDFSAGMGFNLPRGFSAYTTVQEVMRRQREAALQQVQKLRDKLAKCGSCKKTTSPVVLSCVEIELERAYSIFILKAEHAVKVILGQRPNGDVTLDFSAGGKQLSLIVALAGVEVGMYSKDSLQSTATFQYPVENALTYYFDWLTAGG